MPVRSDMSEPNGDVYAYTGAVLTRVTAQTIPLGCEPKHALGNLIRVDEAFKTKQFPC